MNPRNILLIIAAILAPGGVLLLAPLIYRWIRQRQQRDGTVASRRETLQAALPERS